MPYNPLTHDPKTSRMLSPMAKMAKTARLEAETFGQSPIEAELTQLALGVDADSSGVKSYVAPLISLARDHSGTLSELQKMIPLIRETNDTAQKEKITLSDAERSRIRIICDQLIAVISRRTSLLRKFTTTFKNVAREKVATAREKVAETLQQNDAGLFRLAGRLLARRANREQPQGIERDLLNTRANMLGTAVERFGAGRESIEDDYAPRGKRSQAFEQFGDGGTSSEILSVLQDIRSVLQSGNRQDAEQFNRAQEAAERASDDQKSGNFSPIILSQKTGKDRKVGETQTGGGLFSSLGEIGQLLMGAGGLASIVRTVIPALKGLGAGAAVIATAWAAWNVGRWIDEMTGASNVVQRVAEIIRSKFTGERTPEEEMSDYKHEQISRANTMGANIAWDDPKAMEKAANFFTEREKIRREELRLRAHPEEVATSIKVDPQSFFNPTFPNEPAPASTEALTGRHLSTNVMSLPNVQSNIPRPPAEIPATSPKRATPQSFDYDTYAKTIGQRESRGNYRAENTLGFIGKYQFGAAALEDAGLLNPGSSKKGTNKQIINNPANWTLKGGKEAFLSNPQLQERVMRDLTNRNLRTLRRLKVVTAESSSSDIAGYLGAAHLIGAGGVAKKGLAGGDAYGTKASEYFALMSTAQITANRNAATLADASRASSSTPVNVTVAAPQTTIAQNSSTPMLIPVPIQTENRDRSVDNIRAVNVI